MIKSQKTTEFKGRAQSSGFVGHKWVGFQPNINMNFPIEWLIQKGWACVTCGSPKLAVFKPKWHYLVRKVVNVSFSLKMLLKLTLYKTRAEYEEESN